MHDIVSMVISALIAVESGGRADAVGDGGRAVGVLQMWEIAVAEANRLEAIEARADGRTPRTWRPADRLSPVASMDMAGVILRWHYRRGVTDPVELACRWRNPNGNAPTWYRERVAKALERNRRTR